MIPLRRSFFLKANVASRPTLSLMRAAAQWLIKNKFSYETAEERVGESVQRLV
jgi:hypothetical protein